jgi:hypothetical protein
MSLACLRLPSHTTPYSLRYINGILQVKFIGDYHARFISDLIDGCGKTLLLFWDHQLGPQFLQRKALHAPKHIVVLVQGGPNDREVWPSMPYMYGHWLTVDMSLRVLSIFTRRISSRDAALAAFSFEPEPDPVLPYATCPRCCG